MESAPNLGPPGPKKARMKKVCPAVLECTAVLEMTCMLHCTSLLTSYRPAIAVEGQRSGARKRRGRLPAQIVKEKAMRALLARGINAH